MAYKLHQCLCALPGLNECRTNNWHALLELVQGTAAKFEYILSDVIPCLLLHPINNMSSSTLRKAFTCVKDLLFRKICFGCFQSLDFLTMDDTIYIYIYIYIYGIQ